MSEGGVSGNISSSEGKGSSLSSVVGRGSSSRRGTSLGKGVSEVIEGNPNRLGTEASRLLRRGSIYKGSFSCGGPAFPGATTRRIEGTYLNR